MKLILGILGTVTVLLLGGFAGYILYPSLNPNIDTSFSQKQECANYREDIEKKIADEYSWDDQYGTSRVRSIEIWFSSSRHSCLYSFVQDTLEKNSLESAFAYGIYDYLTGEVLFDRSTVSSVNAWDLFEKEKEKLK